MALRLIRALPGERRCCHRCRPPKQAEPDRRHGRGARTTRFRRTLRRFRPAGRARLTPQASIATRATLRDDRETSLMAARAESEDSSDLRNSQGELRILRSRYREIGTPAPHPAEFVSKFRLPVRAMPGSGSRFDAWPTPLSRVTGSTGREAGPGDTAWQDVAGRSAFPRAIRHIRLRAGSAMTGAARA